MKQNELGRSFLMHLQCTKCKTIIDAESRRYICECGGSLSLVYDYDLIADRLSIDVLEKRTNGVWKYKELLPMQSDVRITLGEGGSRLVRCNRLGDLLGFKNLYVKDETKNPTGSFKDRGMTIAISKAREFGANTVAIASTGSAGGSASAYSAKGGMECIVFVPSTAPFLKVVQIGVYGSRIIRTEGSLDGACSLLEEAVRKFGWHDVTTSLKTNPWIGDGLKTAAYETLEQLNWIVPDWVVIPVGSGSNLTSYWQGFKDFQSLGFLNELPRMIASQPSGIAPLIRAYKEHRRPDRIQPWIERKTIASGIGSLLPPDGDTALLAIRESNGTAAHVTDEKILEAEYQPVKRGFLLNLLVHYH